MTKNRIPYERVWKTRELLVETFPGAFKGFKEPKPPLKVGIYLDIKRVLPELSNKALSAALADYTGGPSYLKQVKAGAPRIDLEGKPAGEVLPSQAAYAKERKAIVNQQRAARRKAPTVAESSADGQTAPQQIQQHQAEEGALSA